MDIINFILNNTLVYLPRKINEKSLGGIAHPYSYREDRASRRWRDGPKY